MLRQIISLSFTLLFVLFLTVPSVIVMLDDSVDISIIYASPEEEEKGNEKNQDIEVFTTQSNDDEIDYTALELESNSRYYFKKYPKPHLNLISPPPEQHIS